MDLLLLVLVLLVVLRVMNVLLMAAVIHTMSLLMFLFSFASMNSVMTIANALPVMMLLYRSIIRFFQFVLFFLVLLIDLLLFVMVSTHMTRMRNRNISMNWSGMLSFMVMLGFWVRCSNCLSYMVLHVTLMVFMTLLQTLLVAVASVLLMGKRVMRVRRLVLFVRMALVVMFVVWMMMLFLMVHLFSYFFNFLLDFFMISVQILKSQWNVLLKVFVNSLFFKIGLPFDSEFRI